MQYRIRSARSEARCCNEMTYSIIIASRTTPVGGLVTMVVVATSPLALRVGSRSTGPKKPLSLTMAISGMHAIQDVLR